MYVPCIKRIVLLLYDLSESHLMLKKPRILVNNYRIKINDTMHAHGRSSYLIIAAVQGLMKSESRKRPYVVSVEGIDFPSNLKCIYYA